jgi:hypothetical protein
VHKKIPAATRGVSPSSCECYASSNILAKRNKLIKTNRYGFILLSCVVILRLKIFFDGIKNQITIAFLNKWCCSQTTKARAFNQVHLIKQGNKLTLNMGRGRSTSKK